MAVIQPQHRVTVTTTIDLNEQEMRALMALTIYGTDSFLKTFYDRLGQNYLSKHEHGIRTLFQKIGTEIGPALGDCDTARKALADLKEQRLKEQRDA